MKKFILKANFFVILLIFICGMLDYMSMREGWKNFFAKVTDSEDFLVVNVGTDEIKPYINKVQEKDNTNMLIVGDSVCHQMFQGLQEKNEKVCIVGSNGAITMSGQYVLVKEYIENHPQATDVYLVVLPESLDRTYDTLWGYQYAVMPFVATDTLKLLDENTIEIMKASYGTLSLQPWFVQWVDASAVNRKLCFNLIGKYGTTYRQKTDLEIAEQYISKMYYLCEEKGIEFHLYACPVADDKQAEMANLDAGLEGTWLKEHFPDYFKNIVYFPTEQANDGVHFSGEYAEQKNFNMWIRKILNGSNLLDVLIVE